MSGNINRNFTIFGGTGDLTYRKLLPALYNLYVDGKLHSSDRILIIGRRQYTTDEYINIIRDWVKKYTRMNFNDDVFEKFSKKIHYHLMNFQDINDYQGLSNLLLYVEENIFYYAVAPSFFDVISEGILSLCCAKNIKIIIEKPFGATLEEAEKLNSKLISCFGKENIYRIDHYLGKEMIQSIQTIRFSNQIFRNSWDKNSIQKIEIIANEEVGVETRASYYDNTGALKDMVQNHLLQILSIIAMEEPSSEMSIKESQQKVFENLRPIELIDIEKSMILAQYEGYKQEKGVYPDSNTETYAICKLFIDNERWENVPFYIKTGKKMSTREMEVIVTYNPIGNVKESDVLIFKVQPTEGVRLEFNIKKPGESTDIIRAEMDFCQSCIPAHRINTPEAYERLLNAIMEGDQNLFSTWEHIYLSWKYINELKKLYKDKKLQIYKYKQYSSNIGIILD